MVASFGGADDERLRVLAESLARHLHAFATEVGLTQREWEQGIGILTETGHITDDRRQEFILWSDALGLSMLVDALANPLPPGATESTVLGPFYVPGAPQRPFGASIAAPGYRTLATHIFDRESEYLDSDAVFAVKPSLLREFVRRAADDPEVPEGVEGEWFSVENSIVLAPRDDAR